MHSDNNRSRHYLSPPHAPPPQTRYTQPQSQYPSLYPFPPNSIPQTYEPLLNPWSAGLAPPPPPRPRVYSMVNLQAPPSNQPVGGSIPFPEPQIYRALSERPLPPPPPQLPPPQPPPPPPPVPQSPRGLSHRHSSYDLGGVDLHRGDSIRSVTSTTSSYYRADEDFGVSTVELRIDEDEFERVDELNRLLLDADETLKRFQNGQLPENEQEWHKLVNEEARDALGKQEVQRQSVIFELFRAERDYVADLQTVQDIFVDRLRNASPSVIPDSYLEDFIASVFGNLNDILGHHRRMLFALFERQREQHPLVQSVVDIVLDTVLRTDFRSSYEDYIKHYPLSESRHRKELKRNSAYKTFVQSVADDPRVRKRDLITFLSRPVTRLPRLSLLLEQILKLTNKDFDHPDLESLPTIISILSDFLKSTQPGIEAAESKVKLWELCEHLEFQKGEIIDMDLYDGSRTVVYSGPVVRRMRGETGFSSWNDLTATLLDNYFILTRDSKRSNGTVRKVLMSRPIPLSCLRYASFEAAPETRREKNEEGSILDSLRYHTVEIYPFTVYHASNLVNRRYTLFVTSDVVRKRWRSVLEEAVGIHKVRQEANMLYYPRTLTDSFFRTAGQRTESRTCTGKATAATPFTSGSRRFIAVGCRTGIYVSTWGTEDFKRVLDLANPVQLAAIHTQGHKHFQRLIVHHEHSMFSYSLDILARVALLQAQLISLDASMEHIAGQDSSVLFFRVAEVAQRMLVIFASKRRLQLYPTLSVLEAVDVSEIALTAKRGRKPTSFRAYGESGYVPKDAVDVSPLTKTIGVCTNDGIVIADPTNLANSATVLVPNLQNSSLDPAVSLLKTRIDEAKPLGLLRITPEELMVVYDLLGCFITKHGEPCRSASYVKWESPVKSFAHRGNHVLLFSNRFIEIRDVRNGRLMQVIDGVDIRLLYFNSSVGSNDPIIVGMKGGKDDKDGISDRIVELVETVELPVTSPASVAPAKNSALWEEWDM
ncbi:hypothetical protein AX17_002307 [Amanita inopinata Kibby_2008]|nr:hypothetical protein AX17_002307 [Amanita inopinata Kibby_2008]